MTVSMSCAVSMMYLGPPVIRSNGSYTFKVHADEILIVQSHTANGTRPVFKGCLEPNDEFTFRSSRLIDHHFVITIYVNGIIDQHVFVCCETGFVSQSHFQMQRSSCQLQSITGGIPCEICHSHQLMDFTPNEIPYEMTTPDVQPVIVSKPVKMPTENYPDQKMTLNDTTPKDHSITVVNKNQTKTTNVNTKEKNISSAAKFQMQKLLSSYLQLLHPQTKPSSAISEPASTTQLHTHPDPTVGHNREEKAAIQIASSVLTPTIESKAENFVLIWLDATIRTNNDTLESEEKLRSIVNSLVTCHSIDQAKDFMKQIEDQEIYLIVSGRLAKELVSMTEIIDNTKLNSIYIYCSKKSEYQDLVHRCEKIRDIFDDIDSLCTRLKQDTEQALKNLLPMSTITDEKNQAKFLCAQLHRDLLFTVESTNDAKLELADYCYNIYKSVPTQIRYIEELRTEYHAGNAIHWYTRQTFLFKMLNKALIAQDTSTLYRFHFFIKDLHDHLERMHSLYKPSLQSRVLKVYRGLSMTMATFRKTICAEVNNLIGFDSFLSTSLNDRIAIEFALEKQPPKTESVVFCIEIDVDQMKRPFADISRWSEFRREQEVLFSIGTVFQIVNVAKEKSSDGIWMVDLKSVNDNDEKLQVQTQQIQSALLEFFEDILKEQCDVNNHQQLPASYANVACMYYKQGEYDKSLAFYKKALDALNRLQPTDSLSKAKYITNVAKVQIALNNQSEALSLYEQALQIRRTLCKSDDPTLIHTLHTIGDIYCQKEDWNEAWKYYHQALELQLPALEASRLLDLSMIAATYICLGIVCYKQKRFAEALDSFLKALKQQREHLTEEHPVLAFLYNNIGAMHYKLKQYSAALTNQLTCLTIESKALPKDHKTFIETYENIATTYEKLGQFDQASEYAEKYVEQIKLHHSGNAQKLSEAADFLKRIQTSRDNLK
ncbi:unnamed protein product [Adineta ricciae]|uniref:NAD(P)(+)--arginine ADP-ribosyltransferase n=2 Tax=Adineta ricciae TaxID=249248 RepID=A0A816B3Y9_ADIRI|nr:unnamed protein product [Adineta ricciae]